MAARKKMKGGKAACMDGIVVVMLEKGGISIIDWLMRIFKYIESGVVPEDWKSVCIVLVHKGKDDRRDWANYRGISVLSIPGENSKVIQNTKEQVAEEQGGFRSGRGCIDHTCIEALG